MNILLLTENTNKARFIQNGLRYENLFCELLSLKEPKKKLEEAILTADGLIFLLEDTQTLESSLDTFLQIKASVPIILLSQDFHLSFFELLHEKRKIRNFFTRPFPFRLISAEMRSSIFQEREKIQNKVLQVRDLSLDRETHELKIKNQKIYLPNKEYALLEFLMLNEGKILSRETILENVWDRNANIFTNTVDVHINKLRKKMISEDKFIRTIPCSGYLLA
jgi:DNA-binding response OmpR family regulator